MLRCRVTIGWIIVIIRIKRKRGETMGTNLAGKKRNDRLLQVLTPFLLSRTEIQFAWLFGSYATGRNTASSDIDIAIFVNDPR
ncbi:MAG: nucleotidyltransferase domain-containing protein [Phycisphaerales bacterium]